MNSTRPLQDHVCRVGYWLIAAVVTIAYGLLAWRQLHYGLEYDEAYLLRVISNIASGQGFVDDGVAFFTTGEPFHPYISTGPTLLLPSALVWKITDGSLLATRLVPLAFFAAYLAATVLLFLRWRGRWAVLAALIGPLLLPVIKPDLTNSSLMPGRFVGEIAATAFLLWAAVLLGSRRYAWSGLLAGLAILTKVNFAIPVLALLLTWLAAAWIAHDGRQGRRLLLVIPGLVLPYVAFELYKVASLGWGGYTHNLELMREFTSMQNVAVTEAPTNVILKVIGLAQWASGPMIVVTVTALALLIATGLLAPYLGERSPDWGTRRDPAVVLASVAVAAASLLAWWLLISRQASQRPIIPVALIGLTLLCAVMVTTSFDIAQRAEGRLKFLGRVASVGVVLVLVVCAAYQGLQWWRNTSGQDLLADQEEAVAVIEDNSSTLPIDGFWSNPELGVLSDLPYQAGPRSDPALLVYTSVRALLEAGTVDARVFEPNCGEVLIRTANVLICRPALG